MTSISAQSMWRTGDDPARIDTMRVELLSHVAARVPVAAVLPAARLLGAVLAWSRPRHVRAWRENVRSSGAAAPTSGPAAVFAHHLLTHYEAFAMLGGRRFPVEVDGEEHLRSALDQGNGLLLATAHVGGWNVGAAWLRAATGLPVHTVAGHQIGRSWTHALRRAYRERGVWIHDREGSTPRLLRALRAGEIVVLHVDGDQHSGAGLALRGLHVLAKRSLAPVLPGVVERGPGGVARIRLLPALATLPGAHDLRVAEAALRPLWSERPEQWTLFRALAGGER